MTLTSDLNENRVLLLVGPTAVGKTRLSLQLAERLEGEIVSADSRQIYRHMDIGTAKPTAAEQSRIPHHFIDIRDPDELYSAGEYGREARQVIQGLLANSVVPLVVGGSGFYIRALVDGLFAPQESDANVKKRWRQRYDEEGPEAVWALLNDVDPASAVRLHPHDRQRIVRALEVYDLTGAPISTWQEGDEVPAAFTPVMIGCYRERSHLVQRIEQRVDAMIEAGLVDEVQSLQQRGYSPDLNALRTVGYQEVFAYLQGEMNREEMIEAIRINTRQYAKRQMTWFRRDRRIRWIDLDAGDGVDEVLCYWHPDGA